MGVVQNNPLQIGANYMAPLFNAVNPMANLQINNNASGIGNPGV